MNQPYSHWYAQNSPENLPLAARYRSADPITWNGSLIYPMYTEQVGSAPILVTMKLLSAAPPAGLRGHGIGLSVVDGHIGIDGRRLAGVDVWSDALADGVTFEVVPTDPGALFSLTPVWVDGFGAQKSWSGNYGILIEQPPTGRIILWCSVGEGPPNFANLVVEVETANLPAGSAPTPAAPTPAAAPPTPQPAEPRPDRSAQPTPTTQPQRAVSVAPERPRPPEPQPTPADLEMVRFPESLQTTFARPELPAAEQTTPLQAARTRLAEPSVAEQVPVKQELAADTDHTPLPEAPKPGQSKSQARTNDGDRGYRAALYDLGVAMFGRGEEEQACGLWAQAAEAGHAGAAYDLGVVLFNRGELGDAERWWRTAAERRESRAMTGLAELLERQGNHTEAEIWRACVAEEQTDEHDQSVNSG
ncbi:tetratricopeptide repeat protein [Nocardia sp. NPDC049526]|uniref:tetratricopeptide repeat protein n=1 Tax=Nocardia sp. NPDC049526 TaxID=3364316 RepID=UPI0037AF8151